MLINILRVGVKRIANTFGTTDALRCPYILDALLQKSNTKINFSTELRHFILGV